MKARERLSWRSVVHTWLQVMQVHNWQSINILASTDICINLLKSYVLCFSTVNNSQKLYTTGKLNIPKSWHQQLNHKLERHYFTCRDRKSSEPLPPPAGHGCGLSFQLNQYQFKVSYQMSTFKLNVFYLYIIK